MGFIRLQASDNRRFRRQFPGRVFYNEVQTAFITNLYLAVIKLVVKFRRYFICPENAKITGLSGQFFSIRNQKCVRS